MFVAELAFWSIERRIPAWSDPTLVERRLARLVGACALAGVVAALVVVLAAASGGGGIFLESSGVVASIAALGVLALLVRRFSLR
jgi:predicted membrane-bound spermidine synthase